MSKKKLLFVAPTSQLKAGGEISHFELLLAAKKRGYDVWIVIRAFGELARELKKHSIQYRIIPFNYWYDATPYDTESKQNFESILKIQQLITKEKFDCVITNTFNMPWGAIAAAMANVPHIWIAREYPAYNSRYLVGKYNFVKSFSNLIIANSKALAHFMQADYGLKTAYFYSYVTSKNLHSQRNWKKHPVLLALGISSR